MDLPGDVSNANQDDTDTSEGSSNGKWRKLYIKSATEGILKKIWFKSITGIKLHW
jgi:hypothetical protein